MEEEGCLIDGVEVREVLVVRCEVEERIGGVIARERKRCYVGIKAEMSDIWKR